MSIKSTYDISREVALQVILSKVITLDNKALENMLEEFPESHFRNYIVHDNIDIDELDPWEKDRCIKNATEF